MNIEKISNRYRVKHEIGFYLYGNSEKEVLHKIAILENMKKGRHKMKLNKVEQLNRQIELKENYTEYKKQYNIKEFIKSNVLEENKTYFFNGCYYHNKSLLVNDIKKMFPYSTLQDKIKENENLYYKNLEKAKEGNAFYAIRHKANILTYIYNKDTKDFDFDNIPIQEWRKKVFDYENKHGDAVVLNFDYEFYYL